MTLRKSLVLISCVLLIDQISKIYIKTHFELSESIVVTSWFNIHFIENDGMAWGTKLSDVFSFISDNTAKLFLTLFRIVAVTAIGFWLYNSIKKNSSNTLIFALALIFAGAMGNIIDSVFYGLFFGDSIGTVATFLPADGGYASLFHGKVVDMLYFPLWSGTLPEWLPFYGGEYFSFFNPVFNIADMAISTGIGIFIVFNKKAFKDNSKNETPDLELHNNPI